MAKNKFTFDDLNAELAGLNPLGSVMDQSNFSEVTEWIHTGNYHLNACLSGSVWGGWPNNRSCSIAGPSGTGKTFLTLNSVREAINMGYYVIYYDSEAAVDKDQMKKFGIDISKVNYQPVNTVQAFRTSITTITQKMQEVKRKGGDVQKIMIILDSAGNLATAKEIDDATSGSEKADMTRSKILKSIFRIIMTPLADLKIPFLFTNHTYQTQDFISRQVAGGGCLVPGSKVRMFDNTLKNIEDIVEGDSVLTLNGGMEIENTWTFEKKTYRIEFEDNTIIECSEDHRFFTGNVEDDPLDDNNWILARDLVKNNEVSRYI
jgi:RecA/RadA recombinase